MINYLYSIIVNHFPEFVETRFIVLLDLFAVLDIK